MAKSDQEKDPKAEERHRFSKARFAGLNIVAAIFSAFSGLIANATFGRLDELRKVGDASAAFITQLHWLILFTSAISLYALACYAANKIYPNGEGPIRTVFRVPSWVELRSFGDQRLARISYFALAAIPVVVWFITDNPIHLDWMNGLSIPLNLKISFFVSFFIAIALVLFNVGCPKEFVRRNIFEGTKNVNMVFGNADRAVVQVSQDDQDFYDETLDLSKLEMRASCWLFYLLGLSFSVVLLFRAARLVLYS